MARQPIKVTSAQIIKVEPRSNLRFLHFDRFVWSWFTLSRRKTLENSRLSTQSESWPGSREKKGKSAFQARFLLELKDERRFYQARNLDPNSSGPPLSQEKIRRLEWIHSSIWCLIRYEAECTQGGISDAFGWCVEGEYGNDLELSKRKFVLDPQ